MRLNRYSAKMHDAYKELLAHSKLSDENLEYLSFVGVFWIFTIGSNASKIIACIDMHCDVTGYFLSIKIN